VKNRTRGRGAAASRAPGTSAGLVTIGRIVAPHGLRGEVRVRLETDFPRRFEGLREAWLVQEGAAAPMVITGQRPHRGGVLLVIEGVTGVDGLGLAPQLPHGGSPPAQRAFILYVVVHQRKVVHDLYSGGGGQSTSSAEPGRPVESR